MKTDRVHLVSQKHANIFNVSPGWLLTGEALNQEGFTDTRVKSKPDFAPRLKEDTIDVHDFGRKILELVTELALQTKICLSPEISHNRRSYY